MAERFPLQSMEPVPERAIVVGADLPHSSWDIEDTLAELERLVDTDGAVVVERVTQRISKPNPATFIGEGKAKEIAELCTALDANLVVFDEELTPSQQSKLEKIMGPKVKVIDRTALILDIFALHATSREGKLQVRLAQNQYLYPRLRGMWQHLASNRMGGGVGSRFGEGESQLEVDRRIVRNRISKIRRELKEIDKNRNVQRSQRNRSDTLRIALVGYTNAGKSTLLNALCGTDVLTMDQLFATLDSTTRKLSLPEGREVTLTDTVGFIQKLPTTLIESFKSTLDEIAEADLLLHVVDSSSANYLSQMDEVQSILGQIHAEEVPQLLVFNKADALDDEARGDLSRKYPHAVVVSALTGDGIPELLARIEKACAAMDVLMQVVIPFSEGSLTALAHRKCSIVEESYEEDGTHMLLRVPAGLEPMFGPYESKN